MQGTFEFHRLAISLFVVTCSRLTTQSISMFASRFAFLLFIGIAIIPASAKAELLYNELNGFNSGFLRVMKPQTWNFIDTFPGTNNPLISGMSYDSSTDTLFASDSYTQLGYMDRTTGVFVPMANEYDETIGPISIQPGTFDLFGLDNNGSLYKINKATGVPTLVGGDSIFNAPHAMAFSPDGTLYATDNGPQKLLRIDPATGDATRIAEINRLIINSLAFDSSGTMYGMDPNTGTLVRINKTTGNATTVRSGMARGVIAFVIPEPGTFQLAFVAVLFSMAVMCRTFIVQLCPSSL